MEYFFEDAQGSEDHQERSSMEKHETEKMCLRRHYLTRRCIRNVVSPLLSENIWKVIS